ncbi:glycosyltransferase family 9 protein [Georgenia halophila]|uniref:glycosyltransferase family 9 protein n=1 Tax=Georgenia halophila TaxID=620889 RepID=UPI0031EFF8E7
MTGPARRGEELPGGAHPDAEPDHGERDTSDVLVLRALGLGDAVAGIAALRGLRRAFPGRRLVLAAPRVTGGWLRDLGIVDEVLPSSGLEPLDRHGESISDRDGNGDSGAGGGESHVAVNLHGRGPQSHRLLTATNPARLIAFGCTEAGHDGPAWDQEEHEVDRWCRLVRSAGGDCSPEDLRLDPPGERSSDVVLHPGAASGARRWPVDRWVTVARALARTGRPVAVTGSAGEAGLCEEVAAAAPEVRSLAGGLDLPGLADLVARAGLLLSGDTGVAHLATAYGTPSVVLFGPIPPSWWGPAIDPHLHTVLWHAEEPGDPHADTIDPALEAVTVDEVLSAAEAQLSR